MSFRELAMHEPLLQYMLRNLTPQSPLLLLYLAGMLLAVIFMAKRTAPALLVALGCGGLLLTTLASTASFWFVMKLREENDWNAEKVNSVYLSVGLAYSLCRVLGTGLLLAAAFVGRSSAPAERTAHTRPPRG